MLFFKGSWNIFREFLGHGSGKEKTELSLAGSLRSAAGSMATSAGSAIIQKVS